VKSRKGFVSNSSSSNFIVLNTTNVLQVARKMLTCNSIKTDLLLFDNLVKNNALFITNDIPVTFSSINYDTYLYPDNRNIRVETCSNTTWDLSGFNIQCVDFGDDDKDIFFWDIEKDIMVKPIPFIEHSKLKLSMCQKHWAYPYYIFDHSTIKCPGCYDGETFTDKNYKVPKLYNGSNIRRYNYTRSF
jgi:hypothetical protein